MMNERNSLERYRPPPPGATLEAGLAVGDESHVLADVDGARVLSAATNVVRRNVGGISWHTALGTANLLERARLTSYIAQEDTSYGLDGGLVHKRATR